MFLSLSSAGGSSHHILLLAHESFITPLFKPQSNSSPSFVFFVGFLWLVGTKTSTLGRNECHFGSDPIYSFFFFSSVFTVEKSVVSIICIPNVISMEWMVTQFFLIKIFALLKCIWFKMFQVYSKLIQFYMCVYTHIHTHTHIYIYMHIYRYIFPIFQILSH